MRWIRQILIVLTHLKTRRSLRQYGRLMSLNGADLMDAHLQGADLSQANLRDAILVAVKLQRANLSQADLQNADLAEANLRGANLTEANLQGVRWSDIRADEKTILPDGTHWTPLTDIHRFTDPDHPNFWRSDNPASPAYNAKPTK